MGTCYNAIVTLKPHIAIGEDTVRWSLYCVFCWPLYCVFCIVIHAHFEGSCVACDVEWCWRVKKWNILITCDHSDHRFFAFEHVDRCDNWPLNNYSLYLIWPFSNTIFTLWIEFSFDNTLKSRELNTEPENKYRLYK